MPQTCTTLRPLYETWHSSLSDARRYIKQYIQDGSTDTKEKIRESQTNVKEARAKYEAALYEETMFEGEPIIVKDAVFLEYVEREFGVNQYSITGKRLISLTLLPKTINTRIDFAWCDGLQELSLNNATITNPEQFTFPDGLQWLDLTDATITNPKQLKLPDGLQVLILENATITNPEQLKFPDGLKGLNLNRATITNPGDLRFPDGLKELYLGGAKTPEPEKESVGYILRDTLTKYEEKNSGVTIYI